MAKDITENFIVGILRDMVPGADKPVVLSRGLTLRRYDFHAMSELVVWRTENIEPSEVELDVVETAIRLAYAPRFVARSPKAQQSGDSLAYRFYWPKEKDGLHIRVRSVQMGLGLGV